MTYVNKSPDYLRQKLYSREKDFKNFNQITEESLVNISKQVYKREQIFSEINTEYYRLDKLTRYMLIIQYLTNPSIHITMPTFDERIIFFIMSVDPELITFKEYLKSTITNFNEIRKSPLKEQPALIEKRNSEITEYASRVRTKLGFYDAKLLTYEKQYFNKFFRSKEVIPEVTQDYLSYLLEHSNAIKTFTGISNERYEELKEKAIVWLSMTKGKNNLQTVSYSLITQLSTLGINNFYEQYVFLILVSDPDLEMLTIFEEESRLEKVREKSIEAFGVYNLELLRIERLYHERFCPDKKLSIWSL